MPRMPLDGMDKYRCRICKQRGMRYDGEIVCIKPQCRNFKRGVQKTGSQ